MGPAWLKPFNRTAPIICALILGAIASVGSIDADSIPGSESYRVKVREAIEKIPYRVGTWLGTDVEIPPAAVKLLKPNKLVQRRYVDTVTGLTFNLLIVHCSDTRDMVGHYPPICYPAHGWVEDHRRATSIDLEGARYPAMDYDFYRVVQGAEQKLNVLSFFVLPNGRIVGDREALDSAAGRRSASQLGAAQIQIVSDPGASDAQRREAVEEFVRAIEPTIRAVAEGPTHG